jgi:hypothetical protein
MHAVQGLYAKRADPKARAALLRTEMLRWLDGQRRHQRRTWSRSPVVSVSCFQCSVSTGQRRTNLARSPTICTPKPPHRAADRGRLRQLVNRLLAGVNAAETIAKTMLLAAGEAARKAITGRLIGGPNRGCVLGASRSEGHPLREFVPVRIRSLVPRRRRETEARAAETHGTPSQSQRCDAVSFATFGTSRRVPPIRYAYGRIAA